MGHENTQPPTRRPTSVTSLFSGIWKQERAIIEGRYFVRVQEEGWDNGRVEVWTMRLPHLALFLGLQVSKVLGVEQDVNEEGKSSAAPPNILIMLADDLGWHDLSWHNPRVLLIFTFDINIVHCWWWSSSNLLMNMVIRWSAPTWRFLPTMESSWSSITGVWWLYRTHPERSNSSYPICRLAQLVRLSRKLFSSRKIFFSKRIC